VFSIVEGAHQVCRYGHDARRYNQPKQLPLEKGGKDKKIRSTGREKERNLVLGFPTLIAREREREIRLKIS
jgi:hypothetical protein